MSYSMSYQKFTKGETKAFKSTTVQCGAVRSVPPRGRYLQCTHGTAGHGGTTVTADTVSRQPSRCSAAAWRPGTGGTAVDPASGGLLGSTAPAKDLGGQW